MSLPDELSDMLRDEFEPEVGSPTVTIGTVTGPCFPTTEKRGNLVTEGGFEVPIDFSLTVRKNVFASVALGKMITYNLDGKRYKVVAVSTLPGNTILELDLVDASK